MYLDFCFQTYTCVEHRQNAWCYDLSGWVYNINSCLETITTSGSWRSPLLSENLFGLLLCAIKKPSIKIFYQIVFKPLASYVIFVLPLSADGHPMGLLFLTKLCNSVPSGVFPSSSFGSLRILSCSNYYGQYFSTMGLNSVFSGWEFFNWVSYVRGNSGTTFTPAWTHPSSLLWHCVRLAPQNVFTPVPETVCFLFFAAL